jgi:hypothetical protein
VSLDGQLLTRITAWLAFGSYAWACSRWLKHGASESAYRWWWAGCILLWLHVGCAFQLVHHWSHTAALEATAAQVAALTGWRSGLGLYVNYALLGAWLLHCITRKATRPMHAWLAFMWFFATVVFGHGSVPWVTALVWLALLWQARLRYHGH